jgi:hypothetical protein
MEDNKIYRNLPIGYNKNDNYLDRRQDIYNPPPITNQRLSQNYYSIKNEISTIQAIDIINKLKSPIEYFSYNGNLYRFSDLPMQTLYKNKTDSSGVSSKKLISDQKLFSSTQKSFLDEQSNLLKSTEDEMANLASSISKKDTSSGYSVNMPTPDPKLVADLPIKASYFISNELSGLKEIKYSDLQKEHQIVLKSLLYHFILKFNIDVRESNYDLPYHQWQNYRITDYQIVKLQYHKELNLYLLTVLVEVFRENKHYGFSIYLEMYYRGKKNNMWISKSNLLGTVPQSELVFKKFGTYSIKEKKNTFNAYPVVEQDESILDDLYTKMQNFNYRDENNQSLSYNYQLRNLDLNSGHKCFKPNGDEYPDAKTSDACLSVDLNMNKTGVWDRECSKDSDCPFYQANKNYPNNFGGCKAGKCELPVGMSRIGFKHYNKDKPICYNCNLKDEVMTADGYSVIKERKCSGIECNKCCDIQHKKNIYSNLESPDFVFENDQLERVKYKTLFENKGLGVDSLIIN